MNPPLLPLLIDEGARPSPAIPMGCETLLIGEGGNDARFLAALARSEGNLAACGYGIGGKNQLSDRLFNIVRIEDSLNKASPTGQAFLRLRSFAVVLDADTDREGGPENALKSVNCAMRQDGCFVFDGDFGHDRPKRVKFSAFPEREILAGVFVMPGLGPDNEIKGKLEDLVLRGAMQTHKEEMECVRKFRECARDIGNKPKKEQDEEKKRAQAFLSALPENKVYLGVAAEDGLVDFSAPAYGELKKFLKKLAS